MLTLADAIVLAPDVRIDGVEIVDDTRGTRYPVNDAAGVVLSAAGQPLAVAAARLAVRFRLPNGRARDDVLRFAADLNAAQLANVRPARSRVGVCADWLRLAARLAPAGVVPRRPARRAALDTSSVARALATATRAVLSRAALLAALAGAAAAPLAPVTAWVALAVGVGVGVVAHEAGHVMLLRGRPAALVVTGLRLAVIHPELPLVLRRRVAAAGPVLAASLGVVWITGAWLIASPDLALVGAPASAHAIGLTVVTGDGRAACGC